MINLFTYSHTAGFPGPSRFRKSCFWPGALLLLGWLAATGLQAQELPPGAPPVLPPPPPDTMPLTYSLVLHPEERYPVGDTLPDEAFRFYDPARRHVVDYGTLGNLGSPARPLLFTPLPRQGFDVGVHAYDLYRLDPNGLRFYRNSKTFSDVFFSQGRTQNDLMARAQAGRTFSGGLSFALDYQNFNNQGQFRYQSVKNSGVSAGIWWPLSKGYQLFLTYTSNSTQQQENGGIVTDTLFGTGQFEGPIAAAVRLPDEKAQSRLAERTVQFTQHLDIGLKGARHFRAVHQVTGSRQEFKFFDAQLRRDSLFFDTFLVDLRGIRNYIQLFRLDNDVELQTFRQKKSGTSTDMLSVGLRHTWLDLRQEPSDSAFSNLFLTGRFRLNPSPVFALDIDGALGVLANFGEYRVDGRLGLALGKAGQLEARLSSQRFPPTLLQHRLFVSQQPFWDNNFEKPVETTLEATWTLPAAGLWLSGRTHLVNNYIFMDQRGVATQTTASVQVAQFMAGLRLQARAIHLDNLFALQRANRSDVFRLPEWFAKSSLYFAGNVFHRRMYLESGFDFRMNSSFLPDAYQPVHWQFYLQDTVRQEPYPWLDFFLAFRIQTFRFFFRYENMATLWDQGAVFYQTAWHPQQFAGIRLGIAWRFLDSNVPETGTGAGPDAGGAPTFPGTGF